MRQQKCIHRSCWNTRLRRFFQWPTIQQRDQVGQVQVSNGFEKLIPKKLTPISFTWFDTGTTENYLKTNMNFLGKNEAFDISKPNEFLYIVNGRVVKFFADKKII